MAFAMPLLGRTSLDASTSSVACFVGVAIDMYYCSIMQSFVDRFPSPDARAWRAHIDDIAQQIGFHA